MNFVWGEPTMRVHWGVLYKKLRHLAGPAACLLVAPLANAQDYGTPPPAADEGRVRLITQQDVHQPEDMGPVCENPHSAEAIFATGLPAWGELPFRNTRQPQSLDTPNMIGDALGFTGTLDFSTTSSATTETVDGSFEIPSAGRVPKVAENNSPIPRDRFYFAFNHFNNAYSSTAVVDPNALDGNMMPIPAETHHEQFHQKRFTLGIEKTLFYGDMSVEFRVPLVTQVKYDVPSVTDPNSSAFSFGTDDPNGNFSIILKKVLFDWYDGPTSGVASSGLAFTFPTSEGATVNLGDSRLNIEDAGFHLAPYAAMMITGEKGWFIQGFLEFDYSTDEVTVIGTDPGAFGKADIPDLLNIDVGIGCWLFRAPQRRWFKGLAPIVEYHYSGERQTFEAINLQTVGTLSTSDVTLTGFGSRRDISNLTSGVHVAVSDHVNARIAGVVPLRRAPARQFDAEVIFQLDLVR